MNSNTNYVQISTEQAGHRHGKIYRASGPLFICKEVSRTVPHAFVDSTRGSVHEFSAGAATRMRRYLRECAAQYSHMVTLTYPGFYSSDGAATKEHLRRFLQELKRKVARDHGDTIHYSSFWFLEFQNRGAPHYHIFTTQFFDKQFIAQRWYEIVGSEDKRHLAAGTRVEKLAAGRGGTISYASKYANKQAQKLVPPGYEHVGRFWGVSGYRATMSADTFVSVSQLADPAVLHTTQKLFSLIQAGLYSQTCEVLVRKAGVCVVVFHNHADMAKVRTVISILGCKTGYAHQLFQDAELDYSGE